MIERRVFRAIYPMQTADGDASSGDAVKLTRAEFDAATFARTIKGTWEEAPLAAPFPTLEAGEHVNGE